VYFFVSVCSTKQMIVDVIRCQKSGENLTDILSHSVTPDEVCIDRLTIIHRKFVCLFRKLYGRRWSCRGEHSDKDR